MSMPRVITNSITPCQYLILLISLSWSWHVLHNLLVHRNLRLAIVYKNKCSIALLLLSRFICAGKVAFFSALTLQTMIICFKSLPVPATTFLCIPNSTILTFSLYLCGYSLFALRLNPLLYTSSPLSTELLSMLSLPCWIKSLILTLMHSFSSLFPRVLPELGLLLSSMPSEQSKDLLDCKLLETIQALA